MKKSELNKSLPFLHWAVVKECEVKNGGKIEKFKQVIALFNFLYLAEDYIKNCLPKENADKFSVESVER